MSTAGITYNEDGAVHVAVDAPIVSYSGGLPLAADGALVITNTGVPVTWVAGIPLDVNDRVCVTPPIPPVNLHAFNDGFLQSAFN